MGGAVEFKEMSEKTRVEVGEGGNVVTDSGTRSMKGGKVVVEDKIEDEMTVNQEDSGESAWSMTKREGEGMCLPNVVGGRGSTNGLGKEGGKDEEGSTRKHRPIGLGEGRKSNKD